LQQVFFLQKKNAKCNKNVVEMGVCESNRDIDKRHKSRIEHNLKCNFMLAQMSKEVIREVFACLSTYGSFSFFF